MADSDLQFAFALGQSGQFDQAQSIFEKFISKHPRHFEAIYLFGMLHAQRNNFKMAAELFGRAAKIRPEFLEAHYNRGVALNMIGSHELALKSYAAVLRLKPYHVEAMKNRATSLLKLERFEDALNALDEFLNRMGDSSEVLDLRGVALLELGRLGEALDCHDRALKTDSRSAGNLVNRGIVLSKMDRSEEAVVSYNQSIAIDPENPEAHYNKGIALLNMRRLDEALVSADRALQITAESAESHFVRGAVLNELGRFDEAIESFDRAIQLKPDYAEAYNSKSMFLLLHGKFDEGWKTNEWRKKTFKRLGARTYPQPEWSGEENITGKTLFIHWEQGLGDTIQFCRYARLAAARGAKVILSVQDALMRLLKGLSPTVEIIDSKSTPAQFDYHVALLSVPWAFKTDGTNIPSDVPYLRAEPDLRERWKLRLGDQGFRIGVAWHGSKLGAELGKSFPVTWLHGISRLPGVRLISLQKNEGSGQVTALPEGMKVETLGVDFDSGPDAFLDTAAVMENLDLIVTTDTSIAHVAGALGRPTWVALKKVPDWRWQLDRNDCPWYPTLRLFRQQTRDDWSSVFEAMETELARMIDDAVRRRG